MDRTKGLCLACSASLPPLKSGALDDIFTTNCCRRPICPSCISSNSRLKSYDPCLACLAGVRVAAWSSGNVDDAFILGDDDDDDDDEDLDVSTGGKVVEPITNPVLNDHPAYSEPPARTCVPYKYYLSRTDTLQGLSLRFGIGTHEICKLNNLPASVLRTTPHLLHTRTFLFLPPTTKPHPSLARTILNLGTDDELKSKEEQLVRERAEKKLQTLTKEVDWRVAKAYVALADDEQEQELFALKRKEMTTAPTKSSILEALAIERYFDDLEWEAEAFKAGRDVRSVLKMES